MYIGENSFFVKDSYYIFGGQSYGYKTKLQNQTYNVVSPQYDTYVFKYDPKNDNLDCFYNAIFSASQLSALATTYTASQVSDKSNNRYLFSKMNNLYLGYSSRYSGAFDLGDTIKYPKMCAD
jgi:hypothetical protein